MASCGDPVSFSRDSWIVWRRQRISAGPFGTEHDGNVRGAPGEDLRQLELGALAGAYADLALGIDDDLDSRRNGSPKAVLRAAHLSQELPALDAGRGFVLERS